MGEREESERMGTIVCVHKCGYSRGYPRLYCTVCVYESERPRVSGRDKKKEWRGITKGMLVCMSTTNELHWPDELCSPQKMDFTEMRGSKPGD